MKRNKIAINTNAPKPTTSSYYKRGRTQISGSDKHSTRLKYIDMISSIVKWIIALVIAGVVKSIVHYYASGPP